MGAGVSYEQQGQGQQQQGLYRFRDLSQYIVQIQLVKNGMEDLLNKEKQKIINLNEQTLTARRNTDNEQMKFENLFMKKIELQGQLNDLISKLSSEKQKQYEKDTEELKKQVNEFIFEKKPAGVTMLKKASSNAQEQLNNFMNEAEKLKHEFFKSQINMIKYRADVSIDSDSIQFNNTYLDIKKIEIEMNSIEENFQKLSEELQLNNQTFSERKDFNEKMTNNLTQYEIQIRTKFNEIHSQIDKQQTEKLQQTQIQLNKYIKLCQANQAELDKKSEIIKNLTNKSQEFQNQITQYEYEKQDFEINKQKIQQLKEQIINQENNVNQQIESLNKLKDENSQIIKEIQNLQIEFEEKISTFDLDYQKQYSSLQKNDSQVGIEIKKINQNIQNQIKVSLDYNQIIDNFQQMMNKSIAIFQIQNDKLINIQKELEKNQKINLEYQKEIGKKDNEIFELRLQSKNAQKDLQEKNKLIENLQNQIEELKQSNSKLEKKVAQIRESYEKKYDSLKMSFSENSLITQQQQQIIYENISAEEVSGEIITEQEESCGKQFVEDSKLPSTAKSSLQQSFLKFPPIENTKKQQSRYEKKMKWIDIFYQSESPYTHSPCRTQAKVNSDAMVSCKGGCPSFHIKSAVFDLLNCQVYEQVDFQQLPKNHVQLREKYRSLVDSSLYKAGIVDKEQRDFRQKFRNSYQQQDFQAANTII